jgi:hypothetical protein
MSDDAALEVDFDDSRHTPILQVQQIKRP